MDDVQWADADTLLLLNYLADQELDRLTIVITASTVRPESLNHQLLEFYDH